MSQLDKEQKTGLLLSSIDDDEDDDNNVVNEHLPMTRSTQKKPLANDDQFPIVKKRPKTYQRHRTNFNHPVSFFVILLSAFLFGCLAGVVIMLYRMSQETSLNNDQMFLIKTDSTLKTKLFKSITKENFLEFNRTVESDFDSANRLEKHWKTFSRIFHRVERFSSDLTLSKSSLTVQWSGIVTMMNDDEEKSIRFPSLINEDYLTSSTLRKSGTMESNRIFFLNFGRLEDFAFLIEQNLIDSTDDQTKIGVLKRKSTLISMTEQIRQAIHFGFSALIFFDDDDDEDENQQNFNNQIDLNQRLTLTKEMKRLTTKKDRENLLDGKINDEIDDNPIIILILTKTNVENLFNSIQSDSRHWLSPPEHWTKNSSSIKLGGQLKKMKFHLTCSTQDVPIQLPNVFGFVRGNFDPEHFILVSFQLNNKQQEKIIEQILQTYEQQMKTGWQPKRSIVFAAWSGLTYDRYSIRHWMKKYLRLIDENLIAVIDLGQGIMGNSTLNLHGSPLFEQIVRNAADVVTSPLKHDHNCHKRHNLPGISSTPSSEEHHHSRRHADEHQHQTTTENHDESPEECEQHKLFDEWMRASQNRLKKNQTWNFVQMIDSQSSAALFQLQQGIPSLIIEMTEENFILNETFYQKRLIDRTNYQIQPEVLAAYTQFLSEILRQLSDEALIPFSLTHYADLIDRQAKNFVFHYQRAYQLLHSTLGDPNEFIILINELTSTIRRIQTEIQQTSFNRLDILERLNQKLIRFERLFLLNDEKDPFDQTSKHLLFGSAFGLTNTIVPFPSLSNLLFDVENDFQLELADTSKLHWSKLKEHVQLIQRTLNGFESFRSQTNH